VGRAGVGFDNIDVDAASANGIVVKNAPHGITNATAELALGLMFAVSRNLPHAHHSLKSGSWVKKPYTGAELSHKTLGIIGCGRIGQRLSELVRGFDMEVIGYDAYADDVKVRFPESRVQYVTKEELIRRSDYISLHTGGKAQIIGAAELAAMKPTAYLINASRGSNVDEEALFAALSEKKIAGAGLDTYRNEPKKEGEATPELLQRLASLGNVVLSPHLGASTKEGQSKIAVEMAESVIRFLLKGDFSSAVNVGENVEAEDREIYTLFIYHKDVPGAFAAIDKVLGDHGINIREPVSRHLGAGSAVAVYLVHQPIGPAVVAELNKLEVVHRAKV
jgi:D-3-phosphoglycerate dehydrogenase